MHKFDEVLNRRLTRKEFLLTLGMSFAWLFGISSIIGILSGKGHSPKLPQTSYGSGFYGGDQQAGLTGKIGHTK
jgi:hypothetical protein